MDRAGVRNLDLFLSKSLFLFKHDVFSLLILSVSLEQCCLNIDKFEYSVSPFKNLSANLFVLLYVK